MQMDAQQNNVPLVCAPSQKLTALWYHQPPGNTLVSYGKGSIEIKSIKRNTYINSMKHPSSTASIGVITFLEPEALEYAMLRHLLAQCYGSIEYL